MCLLPLNGFQSLRDDHAQTIVSRDHGNPQRHIATNAGGRSFVTHYKVDGVIIKTGNRCDFLLINEDTRIVYLIELKGSDLSKAALQLEETEKALKLQLEKYHSIQYRIVANRCNVHQIRNTNFNKYIVKWGANLRYASRVFPENI